MAKPAKVEVKEVHEKSIYDIVSQGYSISSAYFAKYRLVSSIFDGMKPVYRRTVIGAYEVCAKDFTKTANLVGHVLGKYHPHNPDSIADVISELVKSNILIGDGEFGSKFLDGTVAPAAAYRYTSVKLNPVYKDLFDKVLKYVPKIDGELDHKEYSYVPMPLPYSAIRGGFGLGPGLSVCIPGFTAKSLLDAIESNDPVKLKSTYGYAILDKNKSLNRIWNSGNGSIYYALKVSRKDISGLQGASISGSAEVFRPDFSRINKWRSNGWVTVNEIGSNGVSEIFVGRNKGVTQVSANDIYNELLNISQYRDMVLIKTIANDNTVHPCGLRTIVKATIENFLLLIEKYKSDKIKGVEYKIQLMKDFDVIKNCIIEHMKDPKFTAEMVAKTTGKDLNIVKDIDSWSVSKLRSTVAVNEIKKLETELNEVKKFDSVKYLNKFIDSISVQESVVDVNTDKLMDREVVSQNEIDDTAEFTDEIEEEIE